MEGGSSKWRQIVTALTASLICLTAGTFFGWSSPVVPKLVGGRDKVSITAEEGEWMMSSAGLPSILVLIALARSFDTIGRKTLLLLSAVPIVAAFLWQIFASTFWELMVSRVLGSLGVMAALIVVPAYLVEISEDAVRGTLVTVGQVLIALGGLMVICIGPYTNLQTLAAILISFPCLFLITFLWMPESPHYLLLKDRRDEAIKSLFRLRGYSNLKLVEMELKKMEQTLSRQQQLEEGGLPALLRHPGNRRTLLVLLGFVAFSVGIGAIPLNAYTYEIFQHAGSSLDANVSSIIVGAVQVLASMLAPLAVDRAGRRPLLLASFAGCSLSLLVEGAYFFLKDGVALDVSSVRWLPLTAFVVFVVAYTSGVGALMGVIQGELLASSVKGLSMCILGSANTVLTSASIEIFHLITNSIGLYAAFWSLGVLSASGIIYVYLFIPETNNRSLMDINEEMNAKAGIVKTLHDCNTFRTSGDTV